MYINLLFFTISTENQQYCSYPKPWHILHQYTCLHSTPHSSVLLSRQFSRGAFLHRLFIWEYVVRALPILFATWYTLFFRTSVWVGPGTVAWCSCGIVYVFVLLLPEYIFPWEPSCTPLLGPAHILVPSSPGTPAGGSSCTLSCLGPHTSLGLEYVEYSLNVLVWFTL